MVERADEAPLPETAFPVGGLSEAGLFEGAGIGLLGVSTAAGRITYANAHVHALLGYAPGALLGAPLDELAVPGAAEGPAPAPGPPALRRWRRADGGAAWLRVTASRADDPAPGTAGGRLLLVVQAAGGEDEHVAETVEHVRLALAAADLGDWSWDAATDRVALSERAAAIVGAPRGALTWGALAAALGADDPAEGGRDDVEAALAAHRPYATERRLRPGPGRRQTWVSARGMGLYAADGRPRGMVGVVQDVTAREEARRALRDREGRLRVATSVAALGIFEWHVLDDRALWENERMWEIFGRAPHEGTIGRMEFVRTVLHPEDAPGFDAAVREALRREGELHVTCRIRRAADGAWRWIDMAGRFEREHPEAPPLRLIGVVADVTDRRLAEERQTLLIRELHHRVKNTLATVQAIVGSTARSAPSIEAFYRAFVGRIMSLAHTHSVLTEATWQTASLRDLLVNELRPYADADLGAAPEIDLGPGAAADAGSRTDDGRIALAGPRVDLPSEIAVPIGMAIHELTTNAAKYGALSHRLGRVAVDWRVEATEDGPRLHFAWRESGGPPVEAPARQGFGSRLLQRVLTAQVQAEVEIQYAPEGLRLDLTAPLPRRNAALNPLAAL